MLLDSDIICQLPRSCSSTTRMNVRLFSLIVISSLPRVCKYFSLEMAEEPGVMYAAVYVPGTNQYA